MRKSAVSLPSSTAEQSFRARLPWVTGDLQTVRDRLVRPRPDPGPSRPIWLELPDGDALAASWHEGKLPAMVLVHGLAGSEDSTYLLRSRAFWARRGRAVLALNLRGSKKSRPRSRTSYFAGAGADIANALMVLPQLQDGCFLVGYSLGGTQLFHALTEGAMPRVIAAATVSAPVDLAATSRRMLAPRNFLYHRFVLAAEQKEARELAPHLPPQLAAAAQAARSVWEFDDIYIARLHGFSGAHDYYARCSLAAVIERIRAPLLCLTAADDPWVPAATYTQELFARNRRVVPRVVPGGGHVGFHDAGHRSERDGSFADRTVAAFFRRVER